MRPKRKFTIPLGSGRASSLGSRDPRIRRDAAARAESVASGKGDSDQALADVQAEITALRAQVAAQEAVDGDAP